MGSFCEAMVLRESELGRLTSRDALVVESLGESGEIDVVDVSKVNDDNMEKAGERPKTDSWRVSCFCILETSKSTYNCSNIAAIYPLLDTERGLHSYTLAQHNCLAPRQRGQHQTVTHTHTFTYQDFTFGPLS
jgi:hypothetical protein